MLGNTIFDPSWARNHYLPITDNGFDIGSATKRFRQLYLSSNVFLANDKIIKFRNAANSTDLDALRVDGSDYLLLGGAATQNHFYTNSTLRFFIENYNFWYNSNFSFVSNTSDGADSGSVNLCGGGSASPTRGAYIVAYGNEHGNAGKLYLATGNASGASILSYISGTLVSTLNSLGIVGNISDFQIAMSTADGSDNGRLLLGGGGAVSSTRGATFVLGGNESSAPGHAQINTGNISGASLDLTNYASNGQIRFIVNSGGTIAAVFNSSAELVFVPTSAVIKQNTADGSDSGSIFLCAGGSNSSSRGAFLSLYGNEHANTGQLTMQAGSGGDVLLWITTNGNTNSVRLETGAGKAIICRDDNTIGIWGNPSSGGGVKVIFIGNASTVPTSNPTAGGILYTDSGALKYRGSSGTVTTIAVA